MPPIQTCTRADVLRLAVPLAAEYGESLTLTAFRRETGLSQWAIFDLFGSWKNLRLALGLTSEAPRQHNRVTREQILQRGRPLAAELGEALTQRTFCQRTGFSSRLISDRFGNWGQLRTELGLARRARPSTHYTDEEMIEDMYGVFRRTGRRPRYHQHLHFGGRISPTAIQHRFGSWAYACECLKERLEREDEEARKKAFRWPRSLPLPEGYEIATPQADDPATLSDQ